MKGFYFLLTKKVSKLTKVTQVMEAKCKVG